MAEPKTKPTRASVKAFFDGIADEQRRRDCRTVAALMKKVTKQEPKMWGPSIVGFGTYRYVYASGRTGDWPIVSFSPRKQNLTLYLSLTGYKEFGSLMEKLGKHKIGKSCLYLDRLDDVDLGVLEKLIRKSVEHNRKTWG